MSNFYFLWHIPATTLQLFLQDYAFCSQFYQLNQISDSSFTINKYLETSTPQKGQQKIQEIQIPVLKKIPQQINFNQQSSNQNSQVSQRQHIDQTKTRQKYGRNITSNIFRSLLKRISSPNRFKKLFFLISKQRNLTISYEQFLEYIERLSLELRSYVKRNEMKRFIVSNSNQRLKQQFCLSFRIMAKIYLKEEHLTSIFYSKKITKSSRRLHFILARQMQGYLK